jgi:hypothetical protein
MATLVLSTVGTALGGPIGGLLGSLVGQAIDQQLLGGGPRKGPRLGDLSVQTSSYGTPIPRIYGTIRVAGTIVWATDLKEDSELQGDGKSQPETVVYTYSASFAVALSCRRAQQVKRIWADGKLIRGAAGDLKVPGKFRFHEGTEGQNVDPLIAEEEGAEQCPAYRGLALAVFEDLQLAEFGNRIPALTFELAAEGGAGVAIGELLADASGGAILCEDERTVGGYAAHGEDIAAGIAPLVEAFAVDLCDEGDALRTPPVEPVRVPTSDELGAGAEISGSAIIEREQAPASSLPAALALSYYDSARDYQTGQARASSPATASRVARALTLPCVLDAGAAKATAEGLLLRAWALRERLTVRLPLTYLDIRPGALLRLPGIAGDWVAEDVEIERFVITVTLRAAWARVGSRSGDPGRPLPQPDVVAAPTRLALFDLPDPASSQPILVAAAASPSGGWRPVPLEIEIAGSITGRLSAAVEAVLGEALTTLGSGQPFLMDLIHHVDVQLANPDHWLESRDDQQLAAGANLAMVGDEMIQFGQALAIAPGKFRLSRLLRGRRGSEWAITGHVAAEAFVLIDTRALKPIAVPVEMLGTAVSVTPHGRGDSDSPTAVTRNANGEAMRPLSPAHLRARFAADGSLMISWVQRSRSGWSWLDEVETPADPSVHGYRLSVSGASATIERDWAEPQLALTPSEVLSLGSGPIEVQVCQIGALALSRPETITVNP